MIHINKAKMYFIQEQVALHFKCLNVWLHEGPVTVRADHLYQVTAGFRGAHARAVIGPQENNETTPNAMIGN